MTKSEQIAAANALIQWFNSQEIAPSDANLVMCKVWAKIMSDKAMSIEAFTKMMDEHSKQLCRDIADRIPHGRR